MPAAANAFCIKSYVNMTPSVVIFVLMLMCVVLYIIAARHHENPTIQPHNVDPGPIQPRQHGSGNHFLDRAESRVPLAKVKHTIERAEQRIEFVCAEQNGQTKFSLQCAS